MCTAGALAVVWSCMSPTEVTLVITTNVDCQTVVNAGGAQIMVGAISDNLDKKSPVAQSNGACTTGTSGPNTEHTIGTFVVIPDQGAGSSEPFAVMVVMGDKKGLGDCIAPDYTGCIIARRELSFVPHTPLTVPIALDSECLNKTCGISNDMTCYKGSCASSKIGNCTGSGDNCTPALPEDAGSTDGSEDGLAEATPGEDAGADHEVVDSITADQGPDVSSIDATQDVPVDTAPVEGAPPEPPGPDAPSSDGPSMDVTVDAPADVAAEGPGPGMDATADDATPDAPADSSDGSSKDVIPDVIEASTPDSTTPDASAGDGGLLGSCVAAGTSPGVACNGGICPSGDVCCVNHDPIGMTTFESCTAPSGCTAGINGLGHQISSFACRNRGDCATGQVCCANPASSAGLNIVCTGSCAQTFTQFPACSNTCECSAGMCKVALGGCYGEPIATCGGACP